MPRGTLTPTKITRGGTAAPAETDGVPADNHQVTNDGHVFLLVRNADGSIARNITFVTPGEYDSGLNNPDKVVSIPTSSSRYFGPFPPGLYNQPGTGLLFIDVDHANLKLTAFTL